MSIATCFLGGGGVVVANILALYAFDRSYTPLSQDKAGFTYPDSSRNGRRGRPPANVGIVRISK